MRGLTFEGKERVRLSEVPEPELLEGTDALVRIEAAAICGSDLHPYHERERGLEHGTVMGHEAVGVITQLGDQVTGLKVGDRVAVPFTTNCGECHFCRIGLTCRCVRGQLFGWVQEGKGLNGLQAELARIPLASTTLFKVPEGVTAEESLLLGDVFSTGFFCAEQAEIRPEGVYVVLGCGPVGLMAIAAAKLLNARKVLAVDTVTERLSLAAKLGAEPIDLSIEDVGERVRAASESRGADGVMECVGSLSASRLAWELVRPGGVISTAGVHTSSEFAFSPVEAYDKNLTFKIGRCPARYYMDRLAPYLKEKRLDIASIITHRVPLDEGPEAYRRFDQRLDGCVKTLLVP